MLECIKKYSKILFFVCFIIALTSCKVKSSIELPDWAKETTKKETQVIQINEELNSYNIRGDIMVYTTTNEQNMFVKQNDLKITEKLNTNAELIDIDPTQSFQTIDGFGASFTDSSAFLINQILKEEDKNELMKKLFDYEDGIGLSFIRNPMGASDFARFIYSYNDLKKGETDFHFEKFSIDHDKEDIIPLTKEALKINPLAKVMATPWSAPGWMKTSEDMIGGSLKEECYDIYGNYFVKFIKAYQNEGIPIYAISPQNEPLYLPEHYPGMKMLASEQVKFINESLGPKFEENNIDTKILCYDHNWDRPDYPETVLAQASKYVAGTAWHVYAGKPEVQGEVYNKFPDKEVHFTESSGGEWIAPFKNAFFSSIDNFIRVLRNHSKSVVLWNIALDEENGPAVPGFGRSTCHGLVKIDKNTKELTYTLHYFTLAHFSKFIKPGAKVINSTQTDYLKTVACENEDGSTVIVVYNSGIMTRLVNVRYGSSIYEYTLPNSSVATFIFNK